MNPKRRSGPLVSASGLNGDGSSAAALAKAVTLHLEGKLKEALRELTSAIERGEACPEIHSARGYLQFELELHEEAVKSYQRLLEAEPLHATGSFNLAICLEKLSRWDEAALHFQKALELNPEKTEARVGLRHLPVASAETGTGVGGV